MESDPISGEAGGHMIIRILKIGITDPVIWGSGQNRITGMEDNTWRFGYPRGNRGDVCFIERRRLEKMDGIEIINYKVTEPFEQCIYQTVSFK